MSTASDAPVGMTLEDAKVGCSDRGPEALVDLAYARRHQDRDVVRSGREDGAPAADASPREVRDGSRISLNPGIGPAPEIVDRKLGALYEVEVEPFGAERERHRDENRARLPLASRHRLDDGL